MADRTFGFRTRALHAGGTPDADDRRPRRADLPDDVLRLRGHPGCRRPLRAAEVRQHLLPHRQPDRRRVRGAHRQPRGRHRRRRHGQRAWPREFITFACARRRRRPHRRLRRALRRHRSPSSTSRCAASASTPRSSPGRPRRLRRGDHRRTPSCSSPRSIANPSGEIADLEGLAEVAHDAGIPLDRRLHDRHALPVPPDRVRRRHRHPLRHQVPRRARHHARRRRRRVAAGSTGATATSR